MEKALEIASLLPDVVVIDRVVHGERELFELIIRRYNQTLFRIGMSILDSDSETEDAMQNAYIKAYEHLDQFGNRSAFGTWLTRIMINESLARKRQLQRRSAAGQDIAEQQTPARMLMNKELGGLLERAISSLPEKYRLVFVLREIEEMSVKDTSEALGIEESNVKVRLNRAKSMLKTHLKDYMKDNVYAFHLSRCDKMVKRVFDHLDGLEAGREKSF